MHVYFFFFCSRNTIDSTVLKKIPSHYGKPKSHPKNIYVDSMEGDSDEDTPRSYQISNNGGMAKSAIKQKGKEVKMPSSFKASLASSVEYVDDPEHIYEMEPTPIYETTPQEEDFGVDDGSVYENTDFPLRESLSRKSSSPAVLGEGSAVGPSRKTPEGPRTRSTSVMTNKKGRRHTPDDYEDPDAVLDNMECGDYVDMDMDKHNTYIDPDDLRRVDSTPSATTSSSSLILGNKRSESSSSVPGPSKYANYVNG